MAPISSFSLSIGTASKRASAAEFDERNGRRIALDVGRLAATSAMWTTCFVSQRRGQGGSADRAGATARARRHSAKAGGTLCMRDGAKRIALAQNRVCRTWPRRCASRSASMAWNTGSSSPGELEMTRSTSEVAVCCSSASASFFSRSASDSRMRSTRASRLRSGRTKLATARSALRPLARQGHLVGTVTGPLPVGPSQGSSLSILTEPHDELAPLHSITSSARLY